jgi:hypothetical protein
MLSLATVNETEAKVIFYIVLCSACTTNEGELKGEITAFLSLKDQYQIQIQLISTCSDHGTKT